MSAANKALSLAALALLMGSGVAGARNLSPEEALARVGSQRAKAAGAGKAELAATARMANGEAGVYAFVSENGYMLLSADDQTLPVLAYGSKDAGLEIGAALPPALEWWMQEYARQVEWNATHQAKEGQVSMFRAVKDRPAVETMLKTSWDQGAPYNDLCPIYDAQKTWTGCVATSMAQVLNYWQYPEKGKGSISYNAESIQKRLTLNFELRKFDWDNMLETYLDGNYSEEEAAAVAYLMKACGYAVKMDYGVDSSGTLAMNIPRALRKYFGYDGGMKHELRQLYTATEWEDVIHKSLADGCPVIYGGGSMIGGGHSFVCDGYDGEGYFHMNWGWTGMADGYFLLDALNPYALGAGGGNGGGYNFTQDAVCGIRPDTGNTYEAEPMTLIQTGSLAGFINDGRLIVDLFAEEEAMWVNYNPETIHARLGLVVTKEGDAEWQPRFHDLFSKPFELAPGYGTGPTQFTPMVELSELDYLTDGCYKLQTAVWLEGAETWTPVKHNHGYFTTMHLTRNGSDWDLALEDVWRLEVVEGEVVSGDLRYGLASRFRIKVRNDADYEMTRGFAPMVICDGQAVMLGESICLTVAPGEEVEKEWTTPLYVLSQQFTVFAEKEVYLTFFDESTYNMWADDYLEKMTLYPNPGAPVVETVGAPVVPGAKTEYSKYLKANVCAVSDKHNIPVESTVRLKDGAFGYEMLACIVNDDMSLETYVGDYVLLNEPGQEHTFKTVINCPTMEDGKLYRLMMGYAFGQYLQQIGPDFTYILVEGASVGELAEGTPLQRVGESVAGNGLVELFDLSGRKVASGDSEVSLAGLPSGIYIARCGESMLKLAL